MVARAVSARHWRFLTSIPRPLAIRSIVKNPRLCGVNWYSIPGLPKPTISFTRIRSSLLAHSSHLFFLFLLGLLGLGFGLGLAFNLALGLAFTLGLLLALLNDFGFSRSCRRLRHRLRSRNHFFLHRGHVRDHLVLVGQKLQLFVVREVFHPHFDTEYKVADVQFDGLRNIRRKALNLDLTQQLLEDAALRLHALGLALEHDGNRDRQPLVHRDALQVHVKQGSLDGFELPVHDHGLHAIAVERQVKNSVVPAFRPQDAQDLPRIDRDRSRFFARPIYHGWNFSADAHAPGGVLGAWFALLRFQKADIRCSRHNSVSVLLVKKSADRSFFVNGLNCPSNQARDRKHLDLRDLLCRFGQRNGVGHDHLGDRRVHKIFHRRP